MTSSRVISFNIVEYEHACCNCILALNSKVWGPSHPRLLMTEGDDHVKRRRSTQCTTRPSTEFVGNGWTELSNLPSASVLRKIVGYIFPDELETA